VSLGSGSNRERDRTFETRQYQARSPFTRSTMIADTLSGLGRLFRFSGLVASAESRLLFSPRGFFVGTSFAKGHACAGI
jgi:hypothetical protein